MKSEHTRSAPLNRRDALKVVTGALGVMAACMAEAQGLSGGNTESGKLGASGTSTRLALLVGNRIYPRPYDLPPVHKNVKDLKAALESRGFVVSTAVDQDSASLKRDISEFLKQVSVAPADASIFFYFTGHGMQVDAENLLLGAGANPEAKEQILLDSSAHFQRDLIRSLPTKPQGMTMLVIDACRTSIRSGFDKADGLNQVEAPQGCLIAFSTGAGKPAISPAVETQNTFYTAALVNSLNNSSGDITFSDMFRKVKSDVQQTMNNHPLAAIRLVAQNPFIAENTSIRLRLSPTLTTTPAATRFDSGDEQALWNKLDQSLLPGEVVQLATSYLERYPKSRLVTSAEVAREGASEAEKVLKRNDVKLYRSAFTQLGAIAPISDDARKAARGDKDASARIARRYLRGADGVAADLNRYEGWMQYASALGNGIACYELAVHYRNQDQPLMASQFEARAQELGFTPPVALDNKRK